MTLCCFSKLVLAAVASAAEAKLPTRTRYQVPLPGISEVTMKAPWAAYFLANRSASSRSGNELSCRVNLPLAGAASTEAGGTLASGGALTTMGIGAFGAATIDGFGATMTGGFAVAMTGGF